MPIYRERNVTHHLRACWQLPVATAVACPVPRLWQLWPCFPPLRSQFLLPLHVKWRYLPKKANIRAWASAAEASWNLITIGKRAFSPRSKDQARSRDILMQRANPRVGGCRQFVPMHHGGPPHRATGHRRRACADRRAASVQGQQY